VRWVRQPPEGAITDPDYFDFYQTGMTLKPLSAIFRLVACTARPPCWLAFAPMNPTTDF
jgi:predicted phosphoadenosine phosphosulfate sulfurtransferase